MLDSNLLVQTINGLKEWLDSCAHFSDALCFTNRSNENSSAIKELTERYKSMCYPMETFILSGKKAYLINQILKPVSLRVTHIFDNPDLLEPEDTPENDHYLEYQSTGIRKMLFQFVISNKLFRIFSRNFLHKILQASTMPGWRNW